MIRFELKFTDGEVAHIWISVRSGDHITRTIARERQDRGELRAGEIVSVYRVS
jgi:hypothetical protein